MNVPPGARPFPSSPTRAAARDLPGFDAFVADHAPDLARTAFLLTGDGMAARHLVVTAVTKVGNRWNTLRWSSPARAALRELFGAFLTRPPKAPPIVNRPSSGDAARTGLHVGPQGLDGRSLTLQVSQAMWALTPRRRALIVARFHEGLPVEHTATLCKMDVRTAWAEIAAALSELKDRLPALAAASDAAATPLGAPAPTAAPASGTAPASDAAPAADEAPASAAPDDLPHEGETSERQTPEAPAGAPSTAWTPPAPRSTSWTAPGAHSTSWIAPEAHSTSWAAPEPQSPPASPGISAPLSGPHGTLSNPSPAATPASRPYPTPYPTPSVTPFMGPQAAEDPAHEALRRHLALLAAETPAVDVPGVTGEILRTARRRRTRRRVRATIAGVAAVGLVGVAVIAVTSALVNGVRDNIRADPGLQAIDDGREDGDARSTFDELPSAVAGSFQYAYRPYCDPDDSMFGEERGDCTSWRVRAGSVEWTIPDAETRSNRALFAISSNGERLAYYDTRLSSLVMVDVDDTRPQPTDLISDPDRLGYDTDLQFSPSGRWLTVDFGQDMGAPPPRLHDFSTDRSWNLPPSLDVLAVAEDGTVTATATTDTRNVPGRIHTTTLVHMRPDGHVLSRVRVEPELFADGAALSGDGRTLALTAWPAHARDNEHGRVVTLDRRTGKIRSDVEATLPEYMSIDRVFGWVNAHQVLVDASDEDENYSAYIVDATTGSAQEISSSVQYGTIEIWAPGTLG